MVEGVEGHGGTLELVPEGVELHRPSPAPWDALEGDTDSLLPTPPGMSPPNVPSPPFHPKHQIPELQNSSTQSLDLTFTEHPLCASQLACGI